MKGKEKYIDNSWRAKMVENGVYKEEKQIEEITKDLKENLRLCAGVKLLDHQVETIAYELSRKYQPKLSKDRVVLTKEEYQKDFSSQFNKGYKHGSKETAEKIYEFLAKADLLGGWALLAYKQFCKEQFNVEIKE